MIETVWPWLALMLLCAGIFAALERHCAWRIFSVMPPIVMTYLLVTTLAVSGLWKVTPGIREAHSLLVARVLPALLFLLMINCDLRAIWKLGPRVLGVFGCATASLLIAFPLTYLIYRHWLPVAAWQPLAALSGSWMGGSANMVAVKQAIGMPDSLLAMSLVTDALCYSLWVALLFSLARLAPAFNRWTRATERPIALLESAASKSPSADGVLLWLGLALFAGVLSSWLGAQLPVSNMISATTWTILLATAFGLIAAQTPLARYPGAAAIAGGLLVFIVAVLASQSNFEGIGRAPLYLICGLTILAIHAGLLLLAARVFHFDLHLCGIASLANIGGVAAAPILAAAYSRALVPAAILLALLGYVIGTGLGIAMASVLSTLAPT
ncbi:MAG TPA: DUF819 family protein [Dokdonella sp.]|uniref:DUF819 family protein n=1 Tax=Dokdonella sp. TaxID=2291710 RepID=UPI002D7EB7E6|nr:DUF819 family protein [Dokdonella sp.]HET9032495.1 DUF819 family protein [Dokdonella sp.]